MLLSMLTISPSRNQTSTLSISNLKVYILLLFLYSFLSRFFAYILSFCIPFLSVEGCRLIAESSYICIQLFRQRLSHKSVKAYATMPIVIMGRKSLALTDRGSLLLPTRKEKA